MNQMNQENKMVKLTAKNDWQNATWYFRNMDEANAFMYVFRNHGCNIKWNIEEKEGFHGMTRSQLDDMNKDPKARAEISLCWAFNSYLPDNPECDISMAMASQIMSSLGL